MFDLLFNENNVVRVYFYCIPMDEEKINFRQLLFNLFEMGILYCRRFKKFLSVLLWEF